LLLWSTEMPFSLRSWFASRGLFSGSAVIASLVLLELAESCLEDADGVGEALRCSRDPSLVTVLDFVRRSCLSSVVMDPVLAGSPFEVDSAL